MKSVLELTEDYNRLVDEGERIFQAVEKDDREPTAKEQKRLNELFGTDGADGEIQNAGNKLEAEKELANQRKQIAAHRAAKRGLFQDDPTAANGGSPLNRFKDGRFMTGEKITMLSKDESLVDYYRASRGANAERVDCANPVGELAKVAVTGVTKHTSEVVAAASTNSNSSGGYTIPDYLMTGIVDKARAMSVVMQAGARTIPMESTSLKIATLTGDPTFSVKSENSSFTPTTITFGQRVLNAYTIGCVYEASRELVEDSPNFPELIEGIMSRSLAVELDRLALQGTGSAEPLGILSDPNLSSTAVSSASNPTWSDLSDAAVQVRVANYTPNAVLLSPANWAHFQEILSGDGSTSAALWQGQPATLDGMRFFASNNMPETTVLSGDFSMMGWGIRQSAMLEVSTHGDAFGKHQVHFKIVFRGDFLPLDHAAFFAKTGISL